ncbi:arginine--tRNA ligase [bacterium MnTg02]|nr:arginine--tRNA ligase [bacterium MnTg02]
MNLFAHFETEILAAVDRLKADGHLPQDAECNGLSVEPPRDAAHGDIATNAAMVLAKKAAMNPRELAGHLSGYLEKSAHIAKIDIAGPGFINLTLKPEFWGQIVTAVLDDDSIYGQSDIGQGEKINVEYVSANPTGPLHVGHCRGAVFGDALANLLAFAGYDVTREYYVNDAGAQVDVFGRSAYLRYREALGEDIGEIPQGLYPGDYLKPVGAKLAEEHGKALLDMEEAAWLPIVREAAVAAAMDGIKHDLAILNIHHDVFVSERSLIEGEEDQVAATIDWLTEQGLVYEGRLPPPKGKRLEGWEDREQSLFRATEFGDDIDRALIKSDGGYTYFASDMAYHRDKFSRGFATMINVWGADHSGYVKRMQAAVRALTGGEGELDIKICQLVNLFRSGEPVKMSKRSGDFVTVRDIVEEVGRDSVRFMMLYRKNDAPLDFDFAKVVEQSRDNPVFYVQYAHARAHSVFRKAHEAFPDLDPDNPTITAPKLSLLDHEAEIAVMKRLAHFPRLVQSAATAHEPHRVAFYLSDLAGDFHGLWNRGKELPQLRFINLGNRELTDARLALVMATARVLRAGFDVLGVRAIKELR